MQKTRLENKPLFWWPIAGILLFIALASSPVSASKTVFTYRSAQDTDDARNRYQMAVLALALEKTKDDYGDFELVPSGAMNNSRAIELLRKHSRENFFLKLSYDSAYPEFMDYVRFPVDLGIVGHRVCFISPEAKLRLPKTVTLDDLRQMTHIQGRGWVDVKVLRHNGFSVDEVSNYSGKFHAVALNRYDLYCRGINEIHNEFEQFSYISGLDYDRSFAFFYPLPRLFYTHKSNSKAIERVSKGVMRAYYDGSLLKLWLNTYQESIQFSKMEDRTIFILENPAIQTIDFDYQQYIYRWGKEGYQAH